MTIILLMCLPYGILAVALLLRLIVAFMRDTLASERRRKILLRTSYVLMFKAMIGMAVLIYFFGPVGIIGFVLGMSVCLSILHAEIRFAGVQNRARQAELLWVLATAVKSGRPLAAEIDAYAHGTSGRRHRLLRAMAERLYDGESMTELAVPQGLLPASSLMQIHSGISSKSLEESLATTALRATRELTEDQKSELPGVGLAYPLILVSIGFQIVAFMMYWIIPKFKQIFDDFDTELPDITKSLIQMSDLTIQYLGLLGLPLFAYLPLAIVVLVGFAEYHSWPILLQNLLGRWFIRWHTPDVLRSLGQSIAQGVPIDQALQPIAQFARPLKLRRQLTLAIDYIHDGDPSWQTLQARGVINSSEAHVLETAERAGNLPWVLDTLASNLERRRLFRLRTLFEVIQPIVLIFVGLIIGYIALSLFMPLIKLITDYA